MMRKYLLSFLLLVMMPCTAWPFEAMRGYFTDLKTGGSISVTVKDAQNARIDRALSTAYILVENGTVWNLESGAGGWYLNDYVEALQRYKDADDPRLPHADISFRDTGRTEVVAGLAGKVFEIDDRRGRMTYEAVLCADEELFAVSQVLLLLYSDLTTPPGRRGPVDKIVHDTGINYGVLRLGDLFEFNGKEAIICDEVVLELPDNLIF